MFRTLDGGGTSFDQWAMWGCLVNEHMSHGDKVIFRTASGAVHFMEAYSAGPDGTIVNVPPALCQEAKSFVVEVEGHPECRTIITVNPAEKPEDYDAWWNEEKQYWEASGDEQLTNGLTFTCEAYTNEGEPITNNYVLWLGSQGAWGDDLYLDKISAEGIFNYKIPLIRDCGEIHLGEFDWKTLYGEWNVMLGHGITPMLRFNCRFMGYTVSSIRTGTDETQSKNVAYLGSAGIEYGHHVVKMTFDGRSDDAKLESVERINGVLLRNGQILSVSGNSVNVITI